MKIHALKENNFTSYEVNISFCVNHSHGNEKHLFTNVGQAKSYIRTDYALKQLKGSIQFYNANIVRKTECIMYKTVMED